MFDIDYGDGELNDEEMYTVVKSEVGDMSVELRKTLEIVREGILHTAKRSTIRTCKSAATAIESKRSGLLGICSGNSREAERSTACPNHSIGLRFKTKD